MFGSKPITSYVSACALSCEWLDELPPCSASTSGLPVFWPRASSSGGAGPSTSLLH